MQLTKFFIALVIEIGKICISEIIIGASKPDGFAELGKAAIGILEACYANQEKTIVFAGDFPGNFIEKLSSQRIASFVLLDNRRRSETISTKIYLNRRHKTHVYVMIAASYTQSYEMISRYWESPYDNPMASLIILGWSSTKQTFCDDTMIGINILYNAYLNDMLKVNFMCRDRTRGIIIYTMNVFVNQAPEPWKFVESQTAGVTKRDFYLYEREYLKHEGMCENLDFDKTRNLNGTEIRTVEIFTSSVRPKDGEIPGPSDIRRRRIEEEKSFNFIAKFITYVNATRKYVWQQQFVGKFMHDDMKSIYSKPVLLRGMEEGSYVYPHRVECKYLVSQFRGYKSQLRKILTVIDNYTWIGMVIVYAITLIFFKYFMDESLLIGILNLCRLTCNTGLKIKPPNAVSEIYLACLFAVMVTMQGIFVGRLASLLTHDFPVQQVDSIQDLADLGYKIIAGKPDFIYFDDPVFDGRIIERLNNDDCMARVLRDPLMACLTWGASETEYALQNNLHISTNCLAHEYTSSIAPRRWALKERLNSMLGIAAATSTMVPLNSMVNEKRLIESESVQVILKPKIMILSDLGFAFAILGIGLGFSILCFIIEIIVYRLTTDRQLLGRFEETRVQFDRGNCSHSGSKLKFKRSHWHHQLAHSLPCQRPQSPNVRKQNCGLRRSLRRRATRIAGNGDALQIVGWPIAVECNRRELTRIYERI